MSNILSIHLGTWLMGHDDAAFVQFLKLSRRFFGNSSVFALWICIYASLCFVEVVKSFTRTGAGVSQFRVRKPIHILSESEVCDGYERLNKLTNMLFLISYDGTRYSGWSAGNQDDWSVDQEEEVTDNLDNKKPEAGLLPFECIDNLRVLPRKSRRRRRSQALGGPLPPGMVRSVQGVLTAHLAKLYGNVESQRIVVEGCSRTDKGVHARSMCAQVYCLSPEAMKCMANAEAECQRTGNMVYPWSSIPGKRKPHPENATDPTWFETIPMSPNRLVRTLNRMLTGDVRVMAIALPPETTPAGNRIPFHPTLSVISKTYRYTFSVGPQHDPTQRRWTWHIDRPFVNEEILRMACSTFVGTHNFTAFQGAARGLDDKKKRLTQDATCTIYSMSVEKTCQSPRSTTFEVSIVGNRFLYKMARFILGATITVCTTETRREGYQLLLDLREALDTGIRKRKPGLFTCAPAHGLVLHKVQFDYNSTIHWIPVDSC